MSKHQSSAYINQENTDDRDQEVEEDVLESSSDDDDDGNNADIASVSAASHSNQNSGIGMGADCDADETYERFVRSVFCDDDYRSGYSNTDEDSEEEYQPGVKSGNDGDDDDDDDDDDDEEEDPELKKVPMREVQELVDGCWQTLAGEAPALPFSSPPTAGNSNNSGSSYFSSSPVSSVNITMDESGHGSLSNAFSYDSSKYNNNDKNIHEHSFGGNVAAGSTTSRRSPIRNSRHASENEMMMNNNNNNNNYNNATGRSSFIHFEDEIVNDEDGHISKRIRSPIGKSKKSYNISSASEELATVVTGGAGKSQVSALKSKSGSPSRNHSQSSMTIDNSLTTAAIQMPPPPRQKPQSLISSLVSQLFSGGKLSDVCVDGMPVDAIRKLVARQMSMASQLLLNMLLYSDNNTDCFTKCYTSLMELSNYRESALKKTALMQMNLQNLTAFQNSRGNRNVAHHRDEGEQQLHQQQQQPEMRLTRGNAGRNVGLSRSWSVFDVPVLANVNALFEHIDESRSELNNNNSSGGISGSGSSNANASSANGGGGATVEGGMGNNGNQRLNIQTRLELLERVGTHIGKIWGNFDMRVWKCLLPTSSFPLPNDLVLKKDPMSLSGRSFFTPAEDDLLLRGIITVGDSATMWEQIRTRFLPSKEVQTLQYRFRTMTSISAAEDTKFKRYLKLVEERQTKDYMKWQLEEDMALLRGYQIYGEKWALISIFFLPHRQRKDIKQRWQFLVKSWLKSNPKSKRNSVISSIGTTDEDLSASMKLFLHFLKGKDQQPNHSNSFGLQSVNSGGGSGGVGGGDGTDNRGLPISQGSFDKDYEEDNLDDDDDDDLCAENGNGMVGMGVGIGMGMGMGMGVGLPGGVYSGFVVPQAPLTNMNPSGARKRKNSVNIPPTFSTIHTTSSNMKVTDKKQLTTSSVLTSNVQKKKRVAESNKKNQQQNMRGAVPSSGIYDDDQFYQSAYPYQQQQDQQLQAPPQPQYFEQPHLDATMTSFGLTDHRHQQHQNQQIYHHQQQQQQHFQQQEEQQNRSLYVGDSDSGSDDDDASMLPVRILRPCKVPVFATTDAPDGNVHGEAAVASSSSSSSSSLPVYMSGSERVDSSSNAAVAVAAAALASPSTLIKSPRKRAIESVEKQHYTKTSNSTNSTDIVINSNSPLTNKSRDTKNSNLESSNASRSQSNHKQKNQQQQQQSAPQSSLFSRVLSMAKKG